MPRDRFECVQNIWYYFSTKTNVLDPPQKTVYISWLRVHMRGSRNFRQGGSRSVWPKKLWVFFLGLSLFYRSQMVNFKEIYHFSRFQRGSNIFQGGVLLFPGGSNCLFPIETQITCDFPGGVQTPCPPLWIRTCRDKLIPYSIITPLK